MENIYVRKSLFMVMFLSLTLTLLTPQVEANNQAEFKVFLDRYPLAFPVEPRVIEGTTLVPFRKLAESIGVYVEWERETQTITAIDQGKVISLKVGAVEASINEKTQDLAQAPFIDQGHTLIPMRFFVEAFGAKIVYEAQDKTIWITSPPKEMYTLAFYGIQSFNHRHYVPRFDGVSYTWSSIAEDGEWVTSRSYKGNLIDYYWPGDHAEGTPEDVIYSGQAVGGEAFLMVAAQKYANIAALVHDQEKVEKAIQGMISTAVETEMDGILLNFENITNAVEHRRTSQALTQFVQKLASEADENDLQIGLALVPPNNHFSGFEYEKLGQLADFILLMAYDYNPLNDRFKPEPMDQVNQGILLTIEQGIPKEKLILGINLGYETAETTLDKMGLAKRHQLKGVGFWILLYLNDERVDLIDSSIPLKK